MGKKILILSATPRKGGNSDRLCDRFAEGARQAGHSVEKILLRDRKINYCTGCGTCYKADRPCPQKDDMPGIIDRMIASDAIVMATPVYFYTMNAQMKTLIDRCCSQYTKISGKEFHFIVAAADDSRPAMERTIEGFRGFTSCLTGAEERSIVYGTGAWQIGDIERTPAMQEAFEAGLNS